MSDKGFYKGEKKKKKKIVLEDQAGRITRTSILPKVEIVGKGKKAR